METKDTPFPPAHEVPLHRNAPLAPTQELAYRKKCIALKRRLAEIEANNDATRKKIILETQRVQKMRLNRTILLNKLQEIMTTPAKKLTPEQLEKLGMMANGNGNLADFAGSGVAPELQHRRPDGEGLLDDSSDETDEDEPEPSERPERRRRANNAYRETVLNTTVPGEPVPSLYQQPALPNLAPANSFSAAPPHEASMLTSSFRVNSSTPQGGPNSRVPPQYPDAGYPHSSPLGINQQLGMPYQSPGQPRAPSIPSSDVNGVARGVPQRPERPEDPYTQFTLHMRPQLEADYPPGEIPAKIQYEWENLSVDNRKLWEDRYLGQMQEYETAMDAWKKARRDAPGAFPVVNS
ncbi:hypothetical protein G647_01011 [Cladophialophora carrionii CBS 160.54]|uniref:HMG box domain-containing protein n=1 Tax=Cladophialophora carrionii CBS 160.54 TaxID=1279043 RepID=V9DPI0_9EURO|nr:uncharacterized protein G647_01011 [Cladophialophora carrionii CBS 160.54]ETI28561.1 hypothetical protein G647_01011 [Cladophialophora carrionii CBS 160.54]